jgi:hypothetical protein
MKHALAIAFVVSIFVPLELVAAAQTQPDSKKTNAPQKQISGPSSMGKSYVSLRPEQKRLADEFVRQYNATSGSKIVPEQAYDGARFSIRTTFDAVTHALLNAKMTDTDGKDLGRAIDLVAAVDEVMGSDLTEKI